MEENKKYWDKNPTCTSKWDEEATSIMFIDENNNIGMLKNILRKLKNNEEITADERFFTITGCVFDRKVNVEIKQKFDEIKNKYWDNGKWYFEKKDIYQKVCFHSEDIRKKRYAFSELKDNYDNFIVDLDCAIKELDFKIISVTIDMVNIVYSRFYQNGIYETALDFLLERLIYNFTNYMYDFNKKVMVVIESRGKKEDGVLLNHLNKIIFETGTYHVESEQFKNKITGVYFNPKHNVCNGRPYDGLELTDLVSYPIHKFVKYGTKDLAFQTLEPKFIKYPDYVGKGLKIYP